MARPRTEYFLLKESGTAPRAGPRSAPDRDPSPVPLCRGNADASQLRPEADQLPNSARSDGV